MAKDRARPFSRKHRRYFLPVTGGMVLIGVLNITIGFCSDTGSTKAPERIVLTLPPPGTPAPATDGTIALEAVPTPVMKAFAVAYPRHVPSAKQLGAIYELAFTADHTTTRVTYKADGTFVGQAAAPEAVR